MQQLMNIKNVFEVFSLTGKYLRLAQKNKFDITELKGRWSEDILQHLNLDVKKIGSPSREKESMILVGNHISYLDIPVLVHSCPDISFVSKSEVKSWPVIGKAAIQAETIFVERGSFTSRKNAKNQIAESLLTKKQKVALFPSGTTSMQPTVSWKKGAFEIAAENKIKVQPFRIQYNPLREAAYIDQDNFLLHMYQLFQFKKIDVTLEFHEPVCIQDSVNDCIHWKKWCEGQI